MSKSEEILCAPIGWKFKNFDQSYLTFSLGLVPFNNDLENLIIALNRAWTFFYPLEWSDQPVY